MKHVVCVIVVTHAASNANIVQIHTSTAQRQEIREQTYTVSISIAMIYSRRENEIKVSQIQNRKR